jgi:hypothetical protein
VKRDSNNGTLHGGAESTVTLVCVDNATNAVIFSVTVDANAAQGQLQVIQAQEKQLLPRINASCFIIE